MVSAFRDRPGHPGIHWLSAMARRHLPHLENELAPHHSTVICVHKVLRLIGWPSSSHLIDHRFIASHFCSSVSPQCIYSRTLSPFYRFSLLWYLSYIYIFLGHRSPSAAIQAAYNLPANFRIQFLLHPTNFHLRPSNTVHWHYWFRCCLLCGSVCSFLPVWV